jgi:DNA invertase Pin-like site-specific DNA recombinase
MLKALAPGNVVTVTRIDRLARSTFDLFAIIKQIVDAGGQFRSLAEPWADTATSAVRIEEIADFVLAIENYEQAGSKLHFLQS